MPFGGLGIQHVIPEGQVILVDYFPIGFGLFQTGKYYFSRVMKSKPLSSLPRFLQVEKSGQHSRVLMRKSDLENFPSPGLREGLSLFE